MTKIRTSLESRQPYTPWNDDELRSKAAKLFHETQGETVMVRLDWLKNDLDRKHVANIGTMMFGGVKK